MTKAMEEARAIEADAWRYRFETKSGTYGKWTVQKNKPNWWRSEGYSDAQLDPLYSATALAARDAEIERLQKALTEYRKEGRDLVQTLSDEAGKWDAGGQHG